MGVYYSLINVTKKEKYEPANGAVKHGNFVYYAEEMLLLLLGEWQYDEVRMCNDSAGGELWDELSTGGAVVDQCRGGDLGGNFRFGGFGV